VLSGYTFLFRQTNNVLFRLSAKVRNKDRKAEKKHYWFGGIPVTKSDFACRRTVRLAQCGGG
jgi:hypothetical protein